MRTQSNTKRLRVCARAVLYVLRWLSACRILKSIWRPMLFFLSLSPCVCVCFYLMLLFYGHFLRILISLVFVFRFQIFDIYIKCVCLLSLYYALFCSLSHAILWTNFLCVFSCLISTWHHYIFVPFFVCACALLVFFSCSFVDVLEIPRLS